MDQPYSATVGADGRAVIKVRPEALMSWTVQQVSIEMATAPVGATAMMRKNGRFVTAMIATGDAAGGDPALLVGPGDMLTIEWGSCTPGHEGTALVIYDEERR